jgi:hypothetical protein
MEPSRWQKNNLLGDRVLSWIFPTILTQAPDEELPFEKSIVQRKDESLESHNNEAKLGQ